MPILVSDIITQSESALDSINFDRYLWEEDFRPAINYAKDWVVSAFNRVFAENKLSEEALRELTKVDVFLTSSYSRVSLNPAITGRTLWSVKAVYPKIEYAGTLATQPNLALSVYCPNVSYLNSFKSAARATVEEVNLNRNNPFAQGNEVTSCEDYIDYSYVSFMDYNNNYTSVPSYELQIYPSIPNEPIAVVYLYYPPNVDLITDTIPFPTALTNIIVNKVLDWISYKQGDNTNLKSVTDEDLKILLTLMT